MSLPRLFPVLRIKFCKAIQDLYYAEGALLIAQCGVKASISV